MNSKYKNHLTKFSEPFPLPSLSKLELLKKLLEVLLTIPGPHGTSKMKKPGRFLIRETVAMTPCRCFFI